MIDKIVTLTYVQSRSNLFKKKNTLQKEASFTW